MDELLMAVESFTERMGKLESKTEHLNSCLDILEKTYDSRYTTIGVSMAETAKIGNPEMLTSKITDLTEKLNLFATVWTSWS